MMISPKAADQFESGPTQYPHDSAACAPRPGRARQRLEASRRQRHRLWAARPKLDGGGLPLHIQDAAGLSRCQPQELAGSLRAVLAPVRSDSALASLPLADDFKAELRRQIGVELEIEVDQYSPPLEADGAGEFYGGHRGGDGAPRSRSAGGAVA